MNNENKRNDWRLDVVQRLTRVETRLDNLSEDMKDLTKSYKDFKKDYYEQNDKIISKLDALGLAVQRLENMPHCNGNSMSRKEKIALYTALITGVSGIIIEIIRVLPALL